MSDEKIALPKESRDSSVKSEEKSEKVEGKEEDSEKSQKSNESERHEDDISFDEKEAPNNMEGMLEDLRGSDQPSSGSSFDESTRRVSKDERDISISVKKLEKEEFFAQSRDKINKTSTFTEGKNADDDQDKEEKRI